MDNLPIRHRTAARLDGCRRAAFGLAVGLAAVLVMPAAAPAASFGPGAGASSALILPAEPHGDVVLAHCCHSHPLPPYDRYCCHSGAAYTYRRPGTYAGSVRRTSRRVSRRTSRRVSRRR